MSILFTTGPWISIERHIVKQRSGLPLKHIAITPGYNYGSRELEESNANALLIASAPELYESLLGVLSWCEEQDIISPMPPVFKSAYEALAKARGESWVILTH